ncbi:MAG: hypothetical protein ABR587_11665 [Candidatus Binatia bacterium]
MRHALLLAVGAVVVLGPLVASLAYQGALEAAFDSLVMRPFQGFVDAHSIRYVAFSDLWRRTQVWNVGGLVYMAVPVSSTGLRWAWPASAVFLVEILHVALYWVPVFGFAGFGLHGLLRIRRGLSLAERSLLATTVFAAAFFLGVFPRADFNHLINVYPPVLAMMAAAGAVHFGKGRWRASAARRIAAVVAAVSLLCFAGVAAVWVNQLRKIYWIPLDSPRAGVLLEPFSAEVLTREIALLRSITASDEPVFALPGLSMIPFLAERQMPTRYYNYYAVHIGHDHGAEAAREIEQSGGRVILADYHNFFSDSVGLLGYGSELAAYIHRNFRPAFSLSQESQMILLRREEPLGDVSSRGLWSTCDVRPGGRLKAHVREHLLFRSLYHSFRGAWGLRNQQLTSCQLKVPAEGRLRMALELRQPVVAVEPTVVRAQVWAFPYKGRPRKLLEHRWSLASEHSWITDAGKEFEIDLSRWEEQPITILLRTLVEGDVPNSRDDPFGLTVMWDGARIESPDYAAPQEEMAESGTPGVDPVEPGASPPGTQLNQSR